LLYSADATPAMDDIAKFSALSAKVWFLFSAGKKVKGNSTITQRML